MILKQLTLTERRAAGSFYTPEPVADWLAARVLAHLPDRNRSCPLVVDPACGDGALLAAILRQSRRTEVKIAGVDLDESALAVAQARLGPSANLIRADALAEDLAGRFGARPSAIIANPPWGADILAEVGHLRTRFRLAYGQFDSFDLFLELAVELLVPGGVLGFVIPDSIFLPEHAETRKLLTDTTTILDVVRLGEGIFEGVFRGAVLFVAKKRSPKTGDRISYARLRKAGRTALQQPSASLDELLSFHEVSQSRLALNPSYSWDLDASDRDEVFHTISGIDTLNWDSYLISGRGIEIGKRGLITTCEACGQSRPTPRKPDSRCLCGAPMSQRSHRSIVGTLRRGEALGWAPLIVGEDVSRYCASPSRLIETGIPGIRYKDVPPDERLLVRKTGLTIQAALDESRAHVTQTVFTYYSRHDAPPYMLSYVLGVLNSRITQAFHLMRSGDSEWRSHPYVTPKVLASLPLPDPTLTLERERLAERISKLARRMNVESSPRADSELDELVSALYGLAQGGPEWARQVLLSAHQLQPIRRLLA